MSRTLMQVARCFPIVAIALLSMGCATKSSTYAKPFNATEVAARPLLACSHVTVAPFEMPQGNKHQDVGNTFALDVNTRLRDSFGPTFDSVAMGTAARGLEGECMLRGTVTEYLPGSRAVRALIPYLGGFIGAASLEGSIRVNDAASGRELLQAPFDKLWMWGGISGATKGMSDMVSETSARIANTVAQARGWEPPTDNEVPGGSKP